VHESTRQLDVSRVPTYTCDKVSYRKYRPRQSDVQSMDNERVVDAFSVTDVAPAQTQQDRLEDVMRRGQERLCELQLGALVAKRV
jgi:hypothetical protein